MKRLYKALTKKPFLDGMLRGIKLGRKLEHWESVIGLQTAFKSHVRKNPKFREGYIQAMKDLEKRNYKSNYEFFGEEEEGEN